MKKTVQFILEIQKILDKKTWIKVKLFYLAVLLSAIFEPIVLVLYKNLLNMLSNQVAFASTIFWVVFGYEFVQLLSGFSMLLIGHEKLKLEYTLNNILIKAVHNKLNRICEEEFEKENYSPLWSLTLPDELNQILSNLNDIAWKGLIDCIVCKPEDFDAKWDEMQQKLKTVGLKKADQEMTALLREEISRRE